MKRIKMALLLLLLSCYGVEMKGQDFNFGIEGYSTNYWTALIGKALLPGGLFSYAPSISLENDAPDSFGTMRNPYARTFSNPFKRMGDCAIGLAGEGYFDDDIPVGLYGSLKFKSTEVTFKGTRLNDRSQYLSPELGLRLRSEAGNDAGLTVGIGVGYDVLIHYKGKIHDYGKSAVNGGLTGNVTIGSYSEDGIFTIKFSMPFYNFYNKDFTPDGGLTLPFKDVDRKIAYFTFSFLRNLD